MTSASQFLGNKKSSDGMGQDLRVGLDKYFHGFLCSDIFMCSNLMIRSHLISLMSFDVVIIGHITVAITHLRGGAILAQFNRGAASSAPKAGLSSLLTSGITVFRTKAVESL